MAEPDFSRTKSLICSERPYTVKGRRNLGGRAIEEGKTGNLVFGKGPRSPVISLSSFSPTKIPPD